MGDFKSLEVKLNEMQSSLRELVSESMSLIGEIEDIKHSTVEDKIVWLRGQGMSFSAIAESIGISRTTVFKKAKQLGLMGGKEDGQ